MALAPEASHVSGDEPRTRQAFALTQSPAVQAARKALASSRADLAPGASSLLASAAARARARRIWEAMRRGHQKRRRMEE